MENFNKSRFLAYGAWDFAINKKLYKNMGITILVIMLGVTVLGFLTKMGVHNSPLEMITMDMTVQLSSWFSMILRWSVAICAGYMFHNMLTRQSRITELTIPASTWEKFLWHFLIAVIAPIVVCWLSIAICDGLNMLLTLIFIGSDEVESIVAMQFFPPSAEDIMEYVQIRTQSQASEQELAMVQGQEFMNTIQHILDKMCGPYTFIFWISSIVFYSGLFGYVNSIKYKHNIPLAIIICIVLGIVVGICAIVAMFTWMGTHKELFWPDSDMMVAVITLFDTIIGWVIGFGIAEFVIGVLLWIGSWFKFKKSQLITVTNK